MTAFIVVEPIGGGVVNEAMRTVLAGAIGGVLLAVIALLDTYAVRLSSRLARARPRWQYALFTLCFASVATMGVLAIVHYRQGWLANAAARFILWSSAAALAMAGVRPPGAAPGGLSGGIARGGSMTGPRSPPGLQPEGCGQAGERQCLTARRCSGRGWHPGLAFGEHDEGIEEARPCLAAVDR